MIYSPFSLLQSTETHNLAISPPVNVIYLFHSRPACQQHPRVHITMEVVTGTRKEAFEVLGKNMLMNWFWGSLWGDGH